MLKEVDKKTWDAILNTIDCSIFNQSDYLETIASLFKTKICYWVIYKKSNPIIGFATHIKSTSIVVPDHFSYSSFWSIPDIGDFSFFEHLEQAIAILKQYYKFISFRLPPSIKDIRAFNLHGFSSIVRYTYINDTSKASFRKNINDKIKRASNLHFAFSFDDLYTENLNQQLNDFKDFGFKENQIMFYQKYFSELIKKGFIHSFNLSLDNKLTSSALVIYDNEQSVAYNILLSHSKSNYQNGEGGYLYLLMIKELNNQGIRTFDLYGANMKGIANFKSGLNGKLTPYYYVRYGFSEKVIDVLKSSRQALQKLNKY